MIYSIDISKFKNKKIHLLGNNFYSKNKKNETINFSSYYMLINDKPYVGASGEFHFSRINENRWEDELIKMKLAGIEIISTYLFWIHHEEIEGEFDFKGRRDIRRFALLCQKYGLKLILRVGPFAHGECRNGGLPDWLYGKPFLVRSTSKGFLGYVTKIFKEYEKQIHGLLFKEGGPIIAFQVDNEYMHSSAPWEITTGVSNEWVNGGTENEKYMNAIKSIMVKVGLIGAFYTATCWGNASCPKDTIPLWGGYAYRPWIFYSHKGKHPATEEYVYQDYHNNDAVCTDDFKPNYKPEERPYLCCEMGGGMMCSYNYRFKLPYKSVDAMANIKLGSGCNLLGYYMFHGGNNPDSKTGIYLNESQVNKISYDYQAAISEFGEIRESYKRLKCIHYFLNAFKEEFASLKTYLPKCASNINPNDTSTCRFAIRSDGRKGFLFINNFQDHVINKDKNNINIQIKLSNEIINFNNLFIPKEENLILPFNLNLSGILLKKTNCQLLTKLKNNTYVFFYLKNVIPEFEFEKTVKIEKHKDYILFSKNNIKAKIMLLSREEANNAYLYNDGLLISNDIVLFDDKFIRINSSKNNIKVKCYPSNLLNIKELSTTQIDMKVDVENANDGKYIITPDISKIDKVKDALLRIDYVGDIALAFINNKLISDNFYNGDTWTISLKDYLEDIKKYKNINITIVPKKEGVKVEAETTMAARNEIIKKITYKLNKVCIEPLYEYKIIR